MTLFEKISWRLNKYHRTLYEKYGVPSYAEKRSIILKYKRKYGTELLIETGTFLGDTIYQLKNDFKKIWSFELSEDLAMRSANRFKDLDHIYIIQGDSGKLLEGLLQTINEPCLFWLDGHYSTEFFIGDEFFVTAKGDKNTPIVEELNAIFAHPVKGHVVLIDDARCFTGVNDYPTIRMLRSIVKKHDKTAKINVRRDIIRITT